VDDQDKKRRAGCDLFDLPTKLQGRKCVAARRMPNCPPWAKAVCQRRGEKVGEKGKRAQLFKDSKGRKTSSRRAGPGRREEPGLTHTRGGGTQGAVRTYRG